MHDFSTNSVTNGKQGRKQLHGYQKKLVSERVGEPAASGMPATAGIPIKAVMSRSRSSATTGTSASSDILEIAGTTPKSEK